MRNHYFEFRKSSSQKAEGQNALPHTKSEEKHYPKTCLFFFLKSLKIILAMYVSSFLTMCIKIPVKKSSLDVTVRHIFSLTSFSFMAELVFYLGEKGKRI